MPDDPIRSAVARIAAHESWAQTLDRSARTAPARAAIFEKFEDMVDPNRELPPEVRAERAASARSAYFGRLSRKGVAARRRNRERRLQRIAHPDDSAAG